MGPTLTAPAAYALIYLIASVIVLGGIVVAVSWLVNAIADALSIGEP